MRCLADGCQGWLNFKKTISGPSGETLVPCEECGVAHQCQQFSLYLQKGERCVLMGDTPVRETIARTRVD
ncbi:MAG: hypothetical protein NTY30_01500 [Candidatus Berkelbacteria bacterium]|nr:hypothetical protein [Candidatus Berkelbacteria bacterium]